VFEFTCETNANPARRHALFTLVGIAGEDDLDAPDLLSPAIPESKADSPSVNKKDRFNGGQRQSVQRAPGNHRTNAGSSRSTLEPEASAALRDQLTSELSAISSSDEAADWAHRVLGAKNSLTAADAKHVEQAFHDQLAILTKTVGGPVTHEAQSPVHRPSRKKRHRSIVDKSVLALSAPRRIRDRGHVKSVAKQPCLVCGRRPADAHHLRFDQLTALGHKVSDEFTVPLCRGHHREVPSLRR
jgi:hypothetical protein